MADSEHVWRVTAGEDPGPRSAVWRIFTHGDEIYVLPRYAGGALKTSLHSSGNFRHAFSEQEATRWVGDADRAFQKWREPQGSAGNARLLLEVMMPTDELTVPRDEPALEEKEKVTLLEPAPPGAATVVSLYLMPPGEEVDSEGKRVTLGPMTLVENWRLPTRGSVLIFASHQPLDPRFPAQIADARREIAGAVGGPLPLEEGHQRLTLIVHNDAQGVATFIDLAARTKRH